MMKPLLPEEIRQAIHARWTSRGEIAKVTGVSIDSRSAKPDEVYVAIRGPKHDGHRFLSHAAAAGCTMAVVARDANVPPETLGLFRIGVAAVDDTVKALGELAAFYRNSIPATVIAVTGSNGKTTVKRMIHHILSNRLTGTAGQKSFNNAIGVPLTVFDASPGDDYVVCEVGTNHLGEVAVLSRICQPDIAVITSIAPSHLEGLRDLPHIASEKAAILTGLRPRGLCVAWADSTDLERALLAYNCPQIRFGTSEWAMLRLTNYKTCGQGQRFQLNDHLDVTLPIPGRHNATNAIAAIAVAQRFGFEQVQAAEALADFDPPEMRLAFEIVGRSLLINDAYNANPGSVLAGGRVLADLEPRRVMIAGDMLELGPEAETLHRDVGKRLAAMGLDLLIGVGPLGRYIAQGAAEADTAGPDAPAIESLQTVAEFETAAADLLKPGDTVLIKGSRGAAMERLLDPIRRALKG